MDDSAFVRKAIIRMFDGHPIIRVADIAADGEMALDLIKKLHPDVVTMDVKMPVMDGLTALQRIMSECPVPVVMLSSLTEKGGENTLRALELGAVDFIDKSSAGSMMDISAIARELTSKILVAAQVDVKKLQSRSPKVEKIRPSPEQMVKKTSAPEVVLIGTSTGGPPALQTILADIPKDYPCPILIVQHMPAGFTASLADRLNRICPIAVKEAVDGEPVLPGQAYIAPAGKHMKLRRSGGGLVIWLDLSPDHALHKPSVDALFESAAAVCQNRCLGFVLTGMGKDGAVGAMAIKKAGGRIVAESEETCRVFGMPKAVSDAVKVEAMVPLYGISDAIVKMI